jgi:hypothetical protein
MSGGSGKNGVTLFAKSLSIGGRYKAADSNLGVNLITAAVTNDGAATVSLWVTKLWITNQQLTKEMKRTTQIDLPGVTPHS